MSRARLQRLSGDSPFVEKTPASKLTDSASPDRKLRHGADQNERETGLFLIYPYRPRSDFSSAPPIHEKRARRRHPASSSANSATPSPVGTTDTRGLTRDQ